jgi:predicted dehydrogenase
MSKLTRRTFLKASAVASASYWLTANAISAARAADEPNGKIHFAAIGVGGKGSSDVDNCVPLGLVVALCDIDDHILQGKFNQEAGGGRRRRGQTPPPENAGTKPYAEAKLFHDYREMFDKMGDKIDAVTVSTPDHTHAPASIRAMKMGKHVYCQKPLTHTVGEARVMRQTAREHKVCTQMGNQGSAEDGLRTAVEIVQAGVLGQVKEVHVWTNRPWTYWKQAPDIMSRPKPADKVPDHIHWDLWLGAAPERPYAEGYHQMKWRGFWDFGTGALGDMACHTANMAFRALKLGSPTNCFAVAGDVNPETYPSFAHVVLHFPARESMGPVTWNWYEGKQDGYKMLPPYALLSKILKPGQRLADSGSIMVGDRGILFSPNDYGAAYTLFGDGVQEAANKVEKTLPRNGERDGDFGMKKEWVEAIRQNKPEIAYSNFDNAGMLAETVLLGNIAIKTGKKLEFDGAKCEITNDKEANALINKEYRKGFGV